MENLFVSYEQAIALKALGFDKPCFGFYKLDDVDVYYDTILQGKNHKFRNNDELNIYGDLKEKISAPTFSQAFRWFRNNHNLHGCIDLHTSTPAHWYIRIDNIKTNDYLFHSEDADLRYDTYESAEQACLDKLIEITKK